MTAEKNDNRMLWVRNLEWLKTHEEKSYSTEFEIRSEQHISGMLNFEDGNITCSMLSLEQSREGLYSYNLTVRSADKEFIYNRQANTNGYYSPAGVVGELVALFALFFRARFFVASTVTIPTGQHGIKMRHDHDYFHQKVSPILHLPILKQKKGLSWKDKELTKFLTRVKNMSEQYHHPFALASTHYLRSLEEIGKDEEMIFIRLVSGIEAISKNFKLATKDDNLEWKKIKTMIRSSDFNKDQQDKLLSLLAVRGSRIKFIRFIEQYCKGYFKGGRKMSTVRIKRADLPEKLDAIYTARSGYLHNGDRMYLSTPMDGCDKWDMDPSLGMGMDNKKWAASEKLPYPWFFEGLVRHCLINFLEHPPEK